MSTPVENVDLLDFPAIFASLSKKRAMSVRSQISKCKSEKDQAVLKAEKLAQPYPMYGLEADTLRSSVHR
jgi:hypothetical protein